MRSTRISALKNVTDTSVLACVAETSLRDFLLIASSDHKTKLFAMDAIGLIKLCRKSMQPFRISEIWPQIQQLSLLPAKHEQTSRALIGSVVSSALEAKDTATAMSVWEFWSSTPRLPVAEVHVSQLLSALRGRPDLVLEVIAALLQGDLGVRANAKHFTIAMQAVVNSPKVAKQVFELAGKHKMVL